MSKSNLQVESKHIAWLPAAERTDRPTLGVVSGQKGSLIVDAGNSPAHARSLFEQMKEHGISPPTYLFLTHWHWDHIFGTQEYEVPIISSIQTRDGVAKMAAYDWNDQALNERVENEIEIEFCRDMIKLEIPNRENLQIQSPNVIFQESPGNIGLK